MFVNGEQPFLVYIAMSFSIIITAGRIGKRMQSTIPKQFLEVKGIPILMHTIRKFYEYDTTCQIILTLPEDWLSYWKELIVKYNFNIVHEVVSGGVERYDSIKNALSYCDSDVIGVHDGVRPLVSHDTIKNCLVRIKEKGSVVPVIKFKESLRRIEQDGSRCLDRKDYVSVQTPQFFSSEILIKSYEKAFHDKITDDASLVEESGFKISLVEGNEENIKITTPFDLKIINLFV